MCEHACKSTAAVVAHGASYPSRCPFPRSRPSLGRTATSKATTRQPGGVLTPETKLGVRTAKELMATGRENDGSDMPRREVVPRFIPGFRGPTPYMICKLNQERRVTARKTRGRSSCLPRQRRACWSPAASGRRRPRGGARPSPPRGARPPTAARVATRRREAQAPPHRPQTEKRPRRRHPRSTQPAEAARRLAAQRAAGAERAVTVAVAGMRPCRVAPLGALGSCAVPT